MKMVLFLIVIMILNFSCKKDYCEKNTDLTPSELSWIPYVNGEVLMFENDSSEKDTVSVERISGYQDFGSYEDGCSITQYVYVTFPVGASDYLQISQRHQISYPKIEWGPELYTRTKRAFLNELPDTNSVIINGISYSNLRLALGYNGTGITNVYYKMGKGIISYKVDSIRWHIVD